MKKHFFILVAFLLVCSFSATAAKHQESSVNIPDTILAAYSDSLEQIYNKVFNNNKDEEDIQLSNPSPYLFRLFGSGTVYQSALNQDMGYDETPYSNTSTSSLPALGNKTDSYLLLHNEINTQLNKAYVTNPSQFSLTEMILDEAGTIHNEFSRKIEEDVHLAEKYVLPDVVDVIDEEAAPIAKKPNFWTIKGNGSLQFSQNFFTENWYQGGAKSYSMLVAVLLQANYDDRQKLQWDNTLDAQLGFQATENSTPKFRATTDLLRLTTKLGYKMAKNWNYAGRVILESQPFPMFSSDGKEITSTFASPLVVKTSIGLDWKINVKKFNGSLYIAPVEYNMTYVHREDIRTRYGMHEDQATKHEWGPNITLTYNWQFLKNVTWNSRLYWFSNFKLTRIEWESTFSFSVNQYLSAKLYLYPRFDDSSTKYYSEENNYFMFKEWLSLGLNITF